MCKPSLIDAHTHLDLYEKEEREKILKELDLYSVEALISVSFHLQSSKRNLAFAKKDGRVKAAAGFHPEQKLPSEREVQELLVWIQRHHQELVAIGEVGLPYYKMKEDPSLDLAPYIELLERFIVESNRLNKPIILHGVYEHAPIICDLLEKHSISKAYFHWFKGDSKTIERMIRNGYLVSVTPDVLYEKEIQQLVRVYPIEGLMVETDGPWRFEGVFLERMTHPGMMHRSIEKVAELKSMSEAAVYKQLVKNTTEFYGL
ncbi:TatD family deoxyribonuclease [Rossellomorea vietnamensis]|uniref:TatD family deoxyribonuclease n=1 Tax=Rossellomorea vietnamensis TaxID=218284 RepID=A0A6I6UQS7_9BACI|nr:TatD family hydrolase [Rossellomorea vietnamensis]QHE60850.1 TatD family deoxyribonuclease [Rossellomorea vietnamensis]